MADKQKILIVDDDENIAELISLYLVKECFDTKIVGDGETALKAVREYGPDLMLLDLMLPGIDGYQVCRELRNFSKIPVIMLSAKGEVFDKVLDAVVSPHLVLVCGYASVGMLHDVCRIECRIKFHGMNYSRIFHAFQARFHVFARQNKCGFW